MQTAAIPYRVADFLKQHPPFQFMAEADLVSLAARGRVKFHESDEYICWQGAAHGPYIFVIQQGSVALWDETTTPPTLRDLRGPGDIVGIERFSGSATSLHSAKSASEVVVYALSAPDFESLLTRNPEAAQYVVSYTAVTSGYRPASAWPQAHELSLAEATLQDIPQCDASAPIREAARLLAESGTEAVALIYDGETRALLTPQDLARWVAAGAVDPNQPASTIALSTPFVLPQETRISECVLAMAEHQTSAAMVSGANRAITASALAPAFGDFPLSILHQIGAASRIESLRMLHLRARVWMLDRLVGPSALEWIAAFSDLVNRRILERALGIMGPNDTEGVWCFYGNAGRRELLTAQAPSIVAIGETASPAIQEALAECGYLDPEVPVAASLQEWKDRFSGWIHDPIRNNIYASRPFFDLRRVLGDRGTFAELEWHVRNELASEPAFLRLLANDCLSSLPPLTFFRDLVVEESGERTSTFRLENNAIQPLVDVGRVFGIAAGTPLGASTSVRLERARQLLPSQDAILREAAETMRVLLFHQARAGLRLGSNGAELPLSFLSRQDRQVLKSGFRSIHQLLEFTAPCDWLEGS